jgi:hypothetical protein
MKEEPVRGLRLYQRKAEREINPMQRKCVRRSCLCVYQADMLNICGIEQRKFETKMKHVANTRVYLNDFRDNES